MLVMLPTHIWTIIIMIHHPLIESFRMSAKKVDPPRLLPKPTGRTESAGAWPSN